MPGVPCCHPSAVAWGLLPSGKIFTDGEALYIAIGIIGATIMP